MQTFRALSCAMLMALCGVELGAAEGAPAKAPKPNIVLVLVDDLRWDVLGAAGHPFSKTPHIDRLAREGAHFRNAFVTTPLCSPSRASFLTGQYAHTHGIRGNSGDDTGHSLENYAKLLKPAGYENGYVGKWHMGADASPRPGFDYWAGLRGQSVHFNPPVNVNGTMVQEKGYTADVVTSYAVAFIRQPRQKPFTLFIGHKAVHGPFQPAPKYRDSYTTEPLPRAPSVEDSLEGRPVLQRTVQARGGDQLHGRKEEIIRNQLRMLRSVDDSVGALLEALEETGQLENTLFIFTSDNGYQWGEHQLGDKRTAYEESIRVPLLMRWPKGIAAGSRPEQMALNIDLVPTFLELAGRAPAPSLQGTSLIPIFENSSAKGRETALFEYFAEKLYPRIPSWQAVRSRDGWKYIRYEFQGMDELYNLTHDPHELKNLIDDPSAATRLAALREELGERLRETGSSLLSQRKETSEGVMETTGTVGAKKDSAGGKKKAAKRKARAEADRQN